MTLLESIMQGVQKLTLPQQVEIVSHIYRLDTAAQQERVEVLRRTHGCLDEADAKAFSGGAR